jgi:tetratricopeptide (TPR) repeat protein
MLARAMLEVRHERWAQAAMVLEEVLRVEPAHGPAREQWAIAQFQVGRVAEAIAGFRRVLDAGQGTEFTWNNLGVILEQQAQYGAAAECYRQALGLNPARAVLHFNLGNALRSSGQASEAAESFRRCIELDPRHADARHNLGVLRKEQGARSEAEQLFRETVALAPGMIDAHVNLGSALQSLGRDEEALECYREALRLAPGYPDAAAGEIAVLDRLGRLEEVKERVAALSEAAQSAPDVVVTIASVARQIGREAEALQNLERLVASERLAPAKLEAALFALGKLCDSRKRFAEAFAYYQRANSVRAQTFDLAEFRTMTERVRATFSAEGMRQFPHAARGSELPVLVVGMPRSGTSLVEQIIASHSQAFGAGELSWLDELTVAWPKRLGVTASYPECAFDFSARALNDAAREYHALLAGAGPGALRVVDKMPGNFAHLGMIELLLPGARIIHVRREPLDNCLSCYFQNFTQGHEYASDLATLGRVYRCYEELMEHWRAVLTLPILEVSYEALVEHQERESRRLMEFCGLPWEEQCLRFHETKRVVRTASYDQVRQPMYRASLARHRHYEEFLGSLREALSG